METSQMSVFTKSSLSFAETRLFDKLLVDYVSDNPLLRDFYSYDDSIDGIKKRINTYSNKRLDRKNLVSKLRDQYTGNGVALMPEVASNIKELENENTFTVTTGHQLNIFSGPLYVAYKLVSVINLCKRLNKDLDQNKFVPVYWMATEDHDMEEISSINVFGKKYQWNYSWSGMSGNAGIENLDVVVNELNDAFNSNLNGEEVRRLINESYMSSKNLAEATRKWTNSLFGKFGLVIVDGNDAVLKKQFNDIVEDELLNQTAHRIVMDSTKELAKNYHLQVNPREINLFYTGPDFRNRIVQTENGFEVLDSNQKFSKEDIITEVRTHSERFSPNVVLRPLYQECVLPNIIYTGGPAEIAYWLELKTLFANYDVPMPALFMRGSAMVIDSNTKSLMQKYSISHQDVFKPLDELIRNYISESDGITVSGVVEELTKAMERLSNEAGEVDPTLRASVDSERQRMVNSLQALEQKIIRAAKKKNETDLNKIRRIKERLFPDEKLQEREASLLTYLLQFGNEFIEMLVSHLDPLEKQFFIFEEEK